jgi:membrane dipeptidase
MLLPARLRAAAEPGDARLAGVLAKTVAIDMHNHVYPAGTEPHPHHGAQGGPQGGPSAQEESHAAEHWIGEELKRAGLAAVCASFVLDFAANDKPGDARVNFLNWLSKVDAQLEKGQIRRALTRPDLERAHAEGQPTIVQTVEGAMFIEGDLGRIAEVYARGLRHLQLLHEHDDMVKPLGDVNTVAAHMGGLTPFGADVVRECNRLGILVDLAHASHETVLGALKVSTKPMLISHTSLDTHAGNNPRVFEMMKPRLISKEHARVVADAGGVVGVWTHMADSLSDFVLSVKQMVDAIGVDHVGMGTDNDLLATRPGQSLNDVWPGLTGGFFPAVATEMLRQGFAPAEIAKIGGGNYCRIFGQATTVRG